MRLAKLGNACLAEIAAGNPAPQDTRAFGTKGFSFVRAGSLDFLCSGGDICKLELIDKDNANKYKLRLFPKDTVIFAKSGMSAKIGRVYKLPQEAYLVSHLAAILPNPKELDSGYLSYFLQAHPPANLIPNDAYPSIRLSEIGNIDIPLPPLSEQKRIAAILDKVDGIIRKRKQSIKLLDELVKAKFMEMFGDLETNSKNWEMRTINKISTNLDSMRIPIKEAERKEGDYPYYGASGIVDFVDSYIFDEPLLLVSEDGANLLARSTPIAFSVKGKIWVNNHAHVLRFKDATIQNYVEYLINFKNIARFITGSAQPKLTQEQLNAIPIPLPHVDLLKIFFKFTKKKEEIKSSFLLMLELSLSLRTVLIKKYFK